MKEWWIDKWKIGGFSVSYLLFLAVLLGLLVLLLYGCVSKIGGPPSVESIVKGRKIEAQMFCKELVEEQLRSPRSARFPWQIDVSSLSDTYFVIESYVDAQNGFGAEIRTHYYCAVSYDPATKRWAIKIFKFIQ